MNVLLVAALLAGAPADLDARYRPVLEAADSAISAGNPQQALDSLDPVIAAYEAQAAAEPKQTYCAMSPTQTLAYMAMGSQGSRGAIAVGTGFCQALYLRGFALFDLNRIPEARATYQRALALAPMHAHYLIELGQTYRMTREWPKMLDHCTRALAATELALDAERKREKGFALRCMGFAQIELGDWDAAEARFNEALRIDPTDANAKSELRYIAAQRRRPTI